jgi:hypothetical protein
MKNRVLKFHDEEKKLQKGWKFGLIFCIMNEKLKVYLMDEKLKLKVEEMRWHINILCNF